MTTVTATTVVSRASDRETSLALHMQIMRQLRRQHFAVLSTAGVNGRPSSAGVSYGVSQPDQELALYVMTRRHLQKARNIAQNPQVALVVPIRRRLLWFLPPATIQLHGRAELLDATDAEGRGVFQQFWLGRRIVKSYQAMERRGETRICFLKITPEPLVRSYMIGATVWSLVSKMEKGIGKTHLALNHQG